jgi:hypothetical protein
MNGEPHSLKLVTVGFVGAGKPFGQVGQRTDLSRIQLQMLYARGALLGYSTACGRLVVGHVS